MRDPIPFVLAGGGSGGHIFPAIAIAEIAHPASHPVVLWTDPRGARYVTPDLPCIDHTELLPSTGPLGYLRTVKKAYALLERYEATWGTKGVMMGFGGAMTLPLLLAARLKGWRTCFHNSDIQPGRANRLLAHIVHASCATRPWRPNMQHIDTPVRATFHHIPDLPPLKDQLHVCILGGSQGAVFWGHIMPQAVALLEPKDRQRLYIYHQAPAHQIPLLETTYRDLGVQALVAEFFHPLCAILAQSHVVLSRAGASSVAEYAAAGRPAFLVPYPYAQQHQTANARQIHEQKGGWLYTQDQINSDTISYFLKNSLHNFQELVYASQCIKKISDPNAARRAYEFALSS